MTARDRPGLRYVALGDSYTIGTAVDPAVTWPAQLVAALAGAPGARGSLQLVANLAVNGRTSGELVREQLPELRRWQPEFVTVLIGVNDIVRGVPAMTYEANLRETFEALLDRLSPSRIVTVGIPDYTVSPRGADYGDPAQRSREIAAFNTIMAGRAAERDVRHVDIADLSLRAATDRSLFATDGLHPSGAQYGLWVGRIAPVVAGLLAGVPTGSATAALEFVEPLVRDPEVVGDLVVDGLGDGRGQGVRPRVGTHQRTAEDRDLARRGRRVG